jgi:DNA-binding transcriptional regulator YiaG
LSRQKSRLPSGENQRAAAILKKRRESEGLSQSQFAKKYGADVDVYRTWEGGRRTPKIEQAFAYLRMLGNEGREELGLHLGPIIDEARGRFDEHRGQAFDALAIILDDAPDAVKEKTIRELVERAGKYGK